MSKRFDISPGWLLTMATAMFIFLPNLFREGMFIDGTLYAILARNLAEGQGSFWAPYFSATYEPVFFAHPPLAFWLESAFFSLLGTSFWVENIFGLFIWGICVWLIAQIWRLLLAAYKPYAWLPVLVWLIVPRVFWSFGNNMLENPLSMWTLAAFWMVLKAQFQFSWRYWGGICAGLFTLAALHTKGPVGLFPLVMPLLLAVGIGRDWKRSLVTTFLLWLSFGLGLGLMLLKEEIWLFWDRYLGKQVIRSLNGQLATDTGPWYLLRRLGEELLPSIGLGTLVGLFSYRFWRKTEIEWGAVKIFFAVAISASFPLFVSPKLRDFYLVPSFPYFALAFCALIVAAWHRCSNLWDRLRRPMQLMALGLMLGAIVVSVSRWGTPKRDQKVLAQVHQIGAIVPQRETIHICNSLEKAFALRWYLNRFYYQSQDHRMRDEYQYFLVQAPCPEFEASAFEQVWEDEGLSLWKRR
ncbi:MAG: glycosyltransferase family 39 protein [Bacteroidota bacterium]